MSILNEEQITASVDPTEDEELTDQENENLESENDKREVKVGDDLNEPDPEGDYTQEQSTTDEDGDDLSDAVPSPS